MYANWCCTPFCVKTALLAAAAATEAEDATQEGPHAPVAMAATVAPVAMWLQACAPFPLPEAGCASPRPPPEAPSLPSPPSPSPICTGGSEMSFGCMGGGLPDGRRFLPSPPSPRQRSRFGFGRSRSPQLGRRRISSKVLPSALVKRQLRPSRCASLGSPVAGISSRPWRKRLSKFFGASSSPSLTCTFMVRLTFMFNPVCSCTASKTPMDRTKRLPKASWSASGRAPAPCSHCSWPSKSPC
mmetsp:Transcript_17582/g.61454  ORF Transcript_17582/g.61454 Transcript_17582/m.61454 type:complete len:242 (-) Transcript_17582:1119-1844(-)